MIWRNIVQADADNWLIIIADQQRIAMRRAPPQTLFTGGDLKIIELQPHSAVEKVETADGRAATRYRQRRVGVCNCLLCSKRMSGHRRSRLIFSLQCKREWSGHSVPASTD